MTSLFWPMLALVLLTAAVAISMGFRRLRAVQQRTVDYRYYRVYQGTGEPESLAAHSRNLSNLFEAPVLFYAGVIVAMAMQLQATWLLGLAWAYVALRFLHSAIHLGSNIVIWRFRVFGLSWLVLVAYWLVLASAISRL